MKHISMLLQEQDKVFIRESLGVETCYWVSAVNKEYAHCHSVYCTHHIIPLVDIAEVEKPISRYTIKPNSYHIRRYYPELLGQDVPIVGVNIDTGCILIRKPNTDESVFGKLHLNRYDYEELDWPQLVKSLPVQSKDFKIGTSPSNVRNRAYRVAANQFQKWLYQNGKTSCPIR